MTIIGTVCDLTDCAELISSAFKSGKSFLGTPTSDAPVLLIIDKHKNEILYWELTGDVRQVAVSQADSGFTPIVLKVVNDDPLRVELWTDNVDQFTIDVELK